MEETNRDVTIKEATELLDCYNSLFGQLYDYNYRLMKESEDDGNEGHYPFHSIFDFYVTSNAQALCKGLLFHCWDSPGMWLNARCVLEGLAIKRMNERGRIPPDGFELLQKQVFLIEHRYYSRFDDIAEMILLPEKLQDDYRIACDFYREKLQNRFSEKEVSAILKSTVPFLCSPYVSFRKLIEENLGEEWARIYGVLSQGIHPSTNTFYRDSSGAITGYLLQILQMVFDEYHNLPPSKTSLQNHVKMCQSSVAVDRLTQLTAEECTMLTEIAAVFQQEKGANYVSDTLQTVSRLHWDMQLDASLALVEQVKSKWKIMLELLAGFDYMYFHGAFEHGEDAYELMKLHKNVQLARNYGDPIDLTEAYKVYQRMYPTGCDRSTFERQFLTLQGFTVDGNGKTQKLTDLVALLMKQYETIQPLNRVMYLDYVESQMLSHANGYMWFANTGAWQDINPVLCASEMLIWRTVEKLHSLFCAAREAGDKPPKAILNVLRNRVRDSDPLLNEKIQLIHTPKVSI